tara:strand:+ start:55 stop:1050 length:996 start_codon:yes stop_codon:yes gene_type:complete
MNKNILVTGGAGYIGSHTIIELLKTGYQPIIIDNLSNSKKNVISKLEKLCKQKIPFYNINCTNQKDMLNDEIWKNIKGVIHFAAHKSVAESVKYPEKYFLNNVGSTELIVKTMQYYKIENLVFSSSCTVYGEPDKLPVTEKHTIKKPTSPYALTKQKCEEIIQKSNLTKYAILRYFNPIGAHKSGLIGELSNTKPNNLVPLISKSIRNNNTLNVFGNDYKTHDGTCIRDYIHVCDVAKAHVKVLDKLMTQNTKKYILNIGLSKGVSVLELIQLFEEANNLKINYKIENRRDGDIEKIYANCKLAEKELGWVPEKSIKEALKDAWNWEKNII